MKISSEKGAKVVYARKPYYRDEDDIPPEIIHLSLDGIYTVLEVDIRYGTRVYLEECPGVAFSPTSFDDHVPEICSQNKFMLLPGSIS